MADSTFNIKELDLKEAERNFKRSRGRGSKYDPIVTKAEDLGKGKALIVEKVSNSEVQGIRQRITKFLGDEWTVSSTKVDEGKYDVLIHREK